MSRCEDEQMWRWEDVKMSRCEDEQVWRWAGVKKRRCEDEQMWWADVKSRCEDEQMWRWEGVKMRRCEDEKVWRWADVKMSRCEDEQVWRWAGVKKRRCEDEKVWRWEGVKMRRWDTDPHYWKNPALRRSREKSRKKQMPAAKANDPRPQKCWLLTLHPPVSACRMVTCVTPCQCLTLLSDPLKKSRKMQMLASNASSPCQRVSNGYLCHPLPVPNVAFWPS